MLATDRMAMNPGGRQPVRAVQQVAVGSLGLPGELSVPPGAWGQVLFAHGQGSSRLSTRNWWVAGVLQQLGLATLLFDLLTEDEALCEQQPADVDMLGERLVQAIDWAARQPDLAGLDVGLFGSGTGVAAAMVAAAARPAGVQAVVSRGGRPDLAAHRLSQVQAPTLLIVGGADVEVLARNRQALRQLCGSKRLEVVPGATHMFAEPGAMASVAALAAGWFGGHLQPREPRFGLGRH